MKLLRSLGSKHPILGDPGPDRGAGGKLGRAETTAEGEGAGRKELRRQLSVIERTRAEIERRLSAFNSYNAFIPKLKKYILPIFLKRNV